MRASNNVLITPIDSSGYSLLHVGVLSVDEELSSHEALPHRRFGGCCGKR